MAAALGRTGVGRIARTGSVVGGMLGPDEHPQDLANSGRGVADDLAHRISATFAGAARPSGSADSRAARHALGPRVGSSPPPRPLGPGPGVAGDGIVLVASDRLVEPPGDSGK